MKESNVMERIKESRKRIKNSYDMKLRDICRIRDCSPDEYSKITNTFVYGYAQGYKAAKAEMKKKAKEAKVV